MVVNFIYIFFINLFLLHVLNISIFYELLYVI